MKVKLVDGMLYLLPETEIEKIELQKWEDNVLKNYDSFADWMVWTLVENEEKNIFKIIP